MSTTDKEQMAMLSTGSIEHETREVLPTAEAARHLLRQPQTLRGWACLGNGPIHPVRINGRLGWRTADIRRLLGGAMKNGS